MSTKSDPPPPSVRPPQRGGGVFIALGLVLGAGFGMAAGEPSLGLMVGLGLGMLLAFGLAMLDKR
ncbi:hypothetical protein [Sandarakinorhabdus sp.]|uniref:hypothetical protein n=1 Tax=Sandarakinorhabdus sp. TaxID=1916663 RepID=UPI00333EB621